MTSSHALGPLELQVVGLFDGKTAFSVADVQKRLRRAGHDPAYTTVMTVLTRLHKKGILTRERAGKHFVYTLARRGASDTSSMLARMHRALFKTVRLRPVAALLDREDLSTEELEALRELVEQKLEERKR